MPGLRNRQQQRPAPFSAAASTCVDEPGRGQGSAIAQMHPPTLVARMDGIGPSPHPLGTHAAGFRAQRRRQLRPFDNPFLSLDRALRPSAPSRGGRRAQGIQRHALAEQQGAAACGQSLPTAARFPSHQRDPVAGGSQLRCNRAAGDA